MKFLMFTALIISSLTRCSNALNTNIKMGLSMKSALIERRKILEKTMFTAGIFSTLFVSEAKAKNSWSDNDEVSLLKNGDTNVYIIGTAHISEKSANLVRDVILATKPEVVLIELDRSRIPKIENNSENSSKNSVSYSNLLDSPLNDKISESATAKKAEPNDLKQKIFAPIISLGAGKVISYMYRSLNSIGFESGGEFKAAIASANEINADVILGDQPIKITMSNLGRAIWLTGYDGFSKFSESDDINLKIGDADVSTKEGIEQVVELIKNRTFIDKETEIIKKELPFIYEAMLGDRDRYMSESIAKYLADNNAQNAVLVVGLAHMKGIEDYLQNKYQFKVNY